MSRVWQIGDVNPDIRYRYRAEVLRQTELPGPKNRLTHLANLVHWFDDDATSVDMMLEKLAGIEYTDLPGYLFEELATAVGIELDSKLIGEPYLGWSDFNYSPMERLSILATALQGWDKLRDKELVRAFCSIRPTTDRNKTPENKRYWSVYVPSVIERLNLMTISWTNDSLLMVSRRYRDGSGFGIREAQMHYGPATQPHINDVKTRWAERIAKSMLILTGYAEVANLRFGWHMVAREYQHTDLVTNHGWDKDKIVWV